MKRILIACVSVAVVVYSAAQAGNLEPPGAPGSTMQELDDLPPSWHKEISGAARFEDFGQAEGYVLDHETGLVWEKAPDATSRTWFDSVEHCYLRTVGGEIGQSLGWRLPTIQELGTIIEPLTIGTPKLPAGHPFGNGISGIYWTATTKPAVGDSNGAYRWNSDFGTFLGAWNKGFVAGQAWCVRSPSGFDIDIP